MNKRKWLTGLAAAMLLVPLVGCTNADHDTAENGRYGINRNTVENGTGQTLIRVPRWDNKQIDVDGDGDAEHISGRNQIGNPSVDLRSFAFPGGGARGSDMTNGVYPHTFTADRIADLAHSVNGVANARALVAGQTVIIGLNLERGVKPQQRGDLVKFVRQRVLVQAPEFQRVHITTDRALTRRIQRISDELRAGHSLTMFNDDVMELTRQVPAVGPNNMPATR